MKLRSGHQSRRNRLDADGLQSVLESLDEPRAGRASVVTINYGRRDGQVDLGGEDDLLEGGNESFGAEGVRELGSVCLPGGVEHLSHGIDEFYSIVLFMQWSARIEICEVPTEKLAFSGLWEAVTMTPMTLPPSFLLLRAASNPTRKITLSKRSALQHAKRGQQTNGFRRCWLLRGACGKRKRGLTKCGSRLYRRRR